jgi:hypothetical protein
MQYPPSVRTSMPGAIPFFSVPTVQCSSGKRKLRTGENVSAVLFIDTSLGECTLELSVLSSFANCRVVEGIAERVLAGLDVVKEES